MALPPIPPTSAASISSISSTSVPSGIKPSGNSSFSDVFAKLLTGVNEQQITSDESIQKLAAGKTDNMQEVVISVAKADLSFRMVLEIRNKLIEAYQEIMRMQV